MTDALKDISTRRTPQNEAARPDQVVNNAGGHVFATSEETQLRRFLVLGTQGGTYYTSEKELTKENAGLVIRLARTQPKLVLDVIHNLDITNRAPKHNTLLFALAAVASLADDVAYRRAAFGAMRDLVRTGTHLFTFVGYCLQFRGWGRGLRTAVADWYTSGDVDQTAYQLVKYRQRDGWSHRDLLRLSHPRTAEPLRRGLFAWATGKRPVLNVMPTVVKDFEAAQTLTPGELVRVIPGSSLSWEMLPDESRTPEVWAAIIEKGMPLTALIRQLPTLTRQGVLDDARLLGIVVGRLKGAEELQRARIHPYAVLLAQTTYASGHSVKGTSTWSPKRQIVDALDAAFYASFGNVTPTGKRFMLALDVSGSMASTIANSHISARTASAALALVTMATEQNVDVVGFTAQPGGLTLRQQGLTTYGWNHRSISELTISPRQRLDDVVRYIDRLDFGRTDCSLPMLYAIEKGLSIDTFVVYTDNETWHGDVHPFQALQMYRQKSGIDAKLIVVGMTATQFSIADPNDAGMLDLVGFDAAGPQLISDFARGL